MTHLTAWARKSTRAAPALELNFLQHIFTILKQHGRATVVLPDNVDSFAPAQSGFAHRFAGRGRSRKNGR